MSSRREVGYSVWTFLDLIYYVTTQSLNVSLIIVILLDRCFQSCFVNLQVVSKPYQTPTGSELAKLCNHKRKLLASVHARGDTSATPPPLLEQKKGSDNSTTGLYSIKSKVQTNSTRLLNGYSPPRSSVLTEGTNPHKFDFSMMRSNVLIAKLL